MYNISLPRHHRSQGRQDIRGPTSATAESPSESILQLLLKSMNNNEQQTHKQLINHVFTQFESGKAGPKR